MIPIYFRIDMVGLVGRALLLAGLMASLPALVAAVLARNARVNACDPWLCIVDSSARVPQQ